MGVRNPGKDAPHFLKAFCIELDSQADQAERRMALLAWARQNLQVGDAVRGHEVFMNLPRIGAAAPARPKDFVGQPVAGLDEKFSY